MKSPQHDVNLCDAERIVDLTLREAFNHARSYQLSCQALVGKAVWLGDLLDRSMAHDMRLKLHQFKDLKNAFFTRYGILIITSLNYSPTFKLLN